MGRMETKEYIITRYGIDISRKKVFIPDMGRNDMASLFNDLGYTRGAEIGTEKGKYAQVLLERIPGLRLYCIDPWEEYLGGEGYLNVGQGVHDRHHQQTLKRTGGYNVKIIKDYSANVVDNFGDNSLDFVYIDGNHRLDFVVQDLVLWTPKVKPGGIVSGHDYIKHAGKMASHVPYALHAYLDAYMYNNFFVMDNGRRGSGKDRIKSWFFIKDDTK